MVYYLLPSVGGMTYEIGRIDVLVYLKGCVREMTVEGVISLEEEPMEIDFSKPIQWSDQLNAPNKESFWCGVEYVAHDSGGNIVYRYGGILYTTTRGHIRNKPEKLKLEPVWDAVQEDGAFWRSHEENLEAFLEELEKLEHIKILK